MGDEGEEDDEDEKEEDDEVPTFGKDGRPQGPTPLYEAIAPEDYPGAGSVVDQQGVGLYCTGESPTAAGVLLVSDLWGWHSGRTRHVADYIAKSLNAFTVVPRLLDTPPLEGGTDGDGLPEGFDKEGREKELRAWLMRYVWETFKPKLDAAAVHLRNNGAKRIAGLGFCFGSWAVCKSSEMTGEFVCSVLAYPSLHLMEDVMDGNPIRLAGRLRGPVLLMPAQDDPVMYGPEGEMFATILRKHPHDAESIPFPAMLHDWAIRGDLAEPDIKASTEECITTAAQFMRKFLWPPPTGANAATLRLMCQEGDAPMVQELLSAGVASGGKDAIDLIGLTPMHYAAKSEGSVAAVKMLVEYEADVNAKGGIGWETPLIIAAGLGRIKAVKALLQAKADLEKPDKGGQTPLHHACTAGSLPVVKELLKAKANMYARDTPSEQAPIHLAAWYGHRAICTCMLRVRIDVDVEDLRVQTPQKRAMQQGFEALADIFEAERKRREDEEWEAANEGGAPPPANGGGAPPPGSRGSGGG